MPVDLVLVDRQLSNQLITPPRERPHEGNLKHTQHVLVSRAERRPRQSKRTRLLARNWILFQNPVL